jgi:RecA-family ATPase
MIMTDTDKGAAKASVKNSEFLQLLYSGIPDKSALWVTSFYGNPDLTDSGNWFGRPYRPDRHALVDSMVTVNSYFSVAALSPTADGEIRRRKANFEQILVLVADDALIDDIKGTVSYVLNTSPGKAQIGIFIDKDDPDAKNRSLVDSIVTRMAENGLLRADASGNNSVRYVRLPVGQNQKPRETGPWDHQLAVWNADCVLSLSDAAAVFGIDVDELRKIKEAAPADAKSSIYDGQADLLRLTASNIVRGERLHESINEMAFSLVACGTHPGTVVSTLRGLMESSLVAKDDRWKARYDDIPRSVTTAVEKLKDDKAPEVTPQNHPFANFLPYALGDLEPDEFIFDDILIAGVTLLAGFTGIGKTTALVPLMTRAAHLCAADDTLRPLLRRKVIYVSEDPKQVVRVLTSMRVENELTASDAEISEWFKIVPAKRMDAASIVKVREIYETMVYRNNSAKSGVFYDALPIVVLDTSNATIELENESDNSEVGKAVSTLKSELGGIPLIIVAHLAKTLKKADISDMTSRGAGAWEGDVNQVLYMTKEDDGARWLDVAQAKHRFVTKADGIVFRAVSSEIKGRDVLGNEKDIFLMHCKPEMVQKGGREAMQEQSKQAAARKKEIAGQMVKIGRKKSVTAILSGLAADEYMTKTELAEALGKDKPANLKLINEMIEGGLIEQFVPTKKRAKQHTEGCRMSGKGAQEYENLSNGK